MDLDLSTLAKLLSAISASAVALYGLLKRKEISYEHVKEKGDVKEATRFNLRL